MTVFSETRDTLPTLCTSSVSSHSRPWQDVTTEQEIYLIRWHGDRGSGNHQQAWAPCDRPPQGWSARRQKHRGESYQVFRGCGSLAAASWRNLRLEHRAVLHTAAASSGEHTSCRQPGSSSAWARAWVPRLSQEASLWPSPQRTWLVWHTCGSTSHAAGLRRPPAADTPAAACAVRLAQPRQSDSHPPRCGQRRVRLPCSCLPGH